MNAHAPSTVSEPAPRAPESHAASHSHRRADEPSDHYGPADPSAPPDPEPTLLAACLRILKLTGGSQYWTGDTQEALEFVERAVAHALTASAPTGHDLANALLLAQSGIGM